MGLGFDPGGRPGGVVAVSATVGELQVALFALRRLDRRLLVHAQHDNLLGRRQVQPDDVLESRLINQR
jgi:hypothetical protein